MSDIRNNTDKSDLYPNSTEYETYYNQNLLSLMSDNKNDPDNSDIYQG
jgi:hypothetical protein